MTDNYALFTVYLHLFHSQKSQRITHSPWSAAVKSTDVHHQGDLHVKVVSNFCFCLLGEDGILAILVPMI